MYRVGSWLAGHSTFVYTLLLEQKSRTSDETGTGKLV